MAAKHTVHVALTEPLVEHDRDQIATGRYATASEACQSASKFGSGAKLVQIGSLFHRG